jgi:hypothetical protein
VALPISWCLTQFLSHRRCSINVEARKREGREGGRESEGGKQPGANYSIPCNHLTTLPQTCWQSVFESRVISSWLKLKQKPLCVQKLLTKGKTHWDGKDDPCPQLPHQSWPLASSEKAKAHLIFIQLCERADPGACPGADSEASPPTAARSEPYLNSHSNLPALWL